MRGGGGYEGFLSHLKRKSWQVDSRSIEGAWERGKGLEEIQGEC